MKNLVEMSKNNDYATGKLLDYLIIRIIKNITKSLV